LKKSITKKGLVVWLKVKALSSSPSTTKKKKKFKHRKHQAHMSSLLNSTKRLRKEITELGVGGYSGG
jgi:ribosomal protein S21